MITGYKFTVAVFRRTVTYTANVIFELRLSKNKQIKTVENNSYDKAGKNLLIFV